MKDRSIKTAMCQLLLREAPLLRTLSAGVGMHPSFVSRWSSFGGPLGICWWPCKEHSQSVNMAPTTPWRAANGTILITMFGLTSVLLKSVQFRRTGQHGAAEAHIMCCALRAGGQP